MRCRNALAAPSARGCCPVRRPGGEPLQMRSLGIEKTPVVVGGIVPTEDATRLRELGISAVYTPKDRGLNGIISDLVEIVRRANGLGPMAA